MNYDLTPEDQQLIEAAQKIIISRYKYGKHHIGAALRTTSGQIFTAVHLGAYVRRMDICAEAIALGMAIASGENSLDTIVAVRHPTPNEADRRIKVVSPCGMCRELLSDYGKSIKVIYAAGEDLVKCDVKDLLPFKYSRH